MEPKNDGAPGFRWTSRSGLGVYIIFRSCSGNSYEIFRSFFPELLENIRSMSCWRNFRWNSQVEGWDDLWGSIFEMSMSSFGKIASCSWQFHTCASVKLLTKVWIIWYIKLVCIFISYAGIYIYDYNNYMCLRCWHCRQASSVQTAFFQLMSTQLVHAESTQNLFFPPPTWLTSFPPWLF